MLSARELNVDNFGTDSTWTSERLVYTHGYGITAVPVDAVTDQGTPDYLVSGINREPQLPLGRAADLLRRADQHLGRDQHRYARVRLPGRHR